MKSGKSLAENLKLQTAMKAKGNINLAKSSKSLAEN